MLKVAQNKYEVNACIRRWFHVMKLREIWKQHLQKFHLQQTVNFAKVFDESPHSENCVFGHKNLEFGNF